MGICIGGPVSSTETINHTVTAGQPLVLTYPNFFDLDHDKRLDLDVTVFGPQGTVTPLSVQFDWIDQNGGIQLSPPTFYNVPGGVPFPIDLTYLIGFCPETVSVDFEIQSSTVTWPLTIQGTFTHTCLVPEATTVVPACAGLAAVLGLAWRRRVKSAA